jgi:eukaryotic-like serine/threonine-protein kinase
MRQIDPASQVRIVPPEPGTVTKSVTVSPDGGFVDFVRGSLGVVHDEVWRIPFLGGTPKKLLDSYVSPVGWSPDGRRIAFVRRGPAKDSLIAADADGSHERMIAPLRQSDYLDAARPASVDGRLVAVTEPPSQAGAALGQVVVVDPGTGAARVVPVSLSVTGSGPAWLDAGSLVLSGVAENGGLDQLWKLSFPGGQLSRLTNDLSRYTGVSLTADRNSLVTARSDMRQSVWVGDRAAISGVEVAALAPGPWDAGVAWAGERLLHVTNANGRTSVAFINGRGAADEIVTRGRQPVATSDGRTIVFVSNETGDGAGLWKIGADGQHAVQLVSGHAVWPVITPDDKRVIFVSVRSREQRLWSVSIDGGPPAQLGDVFAYYPDVSPDGNAVVFGASTTTRGELGICDLPSCTNLRKVTTPKGGPISRWTPDGNGIAYYYDSGPGGNLWVQPLDGSPRRQLTHFTDGLAIEDFAWTRNGARLAIVRVLATSDIVLIKGLRR